MAWENTTADRYRESGVDLDAAEQAKSKIGAVLAATRSDLAPLHVRWRKRCRFGSVMALLNECGYCIRSVAQTVVEYAWSMRDWAADQSR